MSDTKISDGGDRHFRHGPLGDTSTPDGIVSHQHPGHSGMLPRDWFAGHALAGLLAAEARHIAPQDTEDYLLPWSGDEAFFDACMTRRAIELADAMLAAREKGAAQ